MIYLILDTNTWIYLANSKDPSTENFQEGYHFKLFDKLTQKVEDGSIQILKSDLVEKEWLQNKIHTLELVNKYKNKLKSDLTVIKNVQKALDGKYNNELTEVITEYEKSINLKISENESHISKVELLLNNSINFEITDKIKSFSADWAVDKKAPFKGDKKNSMADALILFASIDYIRNKLPTWVTPTSIFVSGNKGDYCSPTDNNKIHEDLEEKLQEVQMGFFNSLPKALNFIDDTLFKEAEIRKIEQEMDELYEDNVHYCNTCSPDEENQYLNVVSFSNSEFVEEESSEFENPNQLKFDFIDNLNIPIIKPNKGYSIQRGFCSWCSTEHIKCENCNTITALDEAIDEGFECDGCGIIYKIINEYVGSGMFEQSIKIALSKSETFDEENNSSS